jgi:hypothetical protein
VRRPSGTPLADNTTGSINSSVSNAEKILERMRANSKADWRIEDCQVLARRFGVTWEVTGSHATFRSPGGNRITVPVRRPIKPIYIKLFVEFIDHIKEE